MKLVESDCNTLTGARAIAEFLGMTPRQVFHRVEDGTLPVFRMGKSICARPATLREWIERLESEASR